MTNPTTLGASPPGGGLRPKKTKNIQGSAQNTWQKPPELRAMTHEYPCSHTRYGFSLLNLGSYIHNTYMYIHVYTLNTYVYQVTNCRVGVGVTRVSVNSIHPKYTVKLWWLIAWMWGRCRCSCMHPISYQGSKVIV